MFGRPRSIGGITLLIAALLAGCMPQQPFYFHPDCNADLSHYVGLATEIEEPNVNERPLREVEGAMRPFSLTNMDAKQIWNLKLEDAIRNALENSKVIRSLGGVLTSPQSFVSVNGAINGPPVSITQQADAVATIYDPALAESSVRPGQTGAPGVEAALALFDAQLTSSAVWNRNHVPQNVSPEFAFLSPSDYLQETFQSQTVLTKTTATGAVCTVTNTFGYDLENNLTRALPADWTANFQLQVRQPLLQGAGVEFNEIAGPGATPGVNNGVVLARLNTDIALADFETNVRDMVYGVEKAYWELYFSYRNLDAAIAGRNSALETWRRIHALFVVSAEGGEADKEAQAREQYFLFRSTVETALKNLYESEAALRYLMGLASTDGRLIRPADEPTVAKVCFDWTETHTEALCRSVELRRQRFRLKQRELELIAAKNYLKPRVDAIAQYTWTGMGANLLGAPGFDATTGMDNTALQSLEHGDYQSWELGVTAQWNIGFHKEMSNVRYCQLAVAREQAKLQDEELEISHQVAFAIRDMESNLTLAETDFNRRMAAQREVEAVQAAYDTGKITLDVLLQSQRTLADAESNYYRVLVSYNESIAEVHLRKGSLLEYNGVCLAEGPWPGKAYFDARRRARARDAAHYLNYAITLPRVVSRGPYNQWADSGDPRAAGAGGGQPAAATPPEGQPETIPTPAPTQAPATQPNQTPNADEPLTHPSPVETDRSAAGWQGVQY
jgi:outer membrane protein TolC